MTNQRNRAQRVRAKLSSVSTKPRLSVFRSGKNIWAQIIDDTKGITLASAGDKALGTKGTKTEKAAVVGEAIAKAALAKKVKTVVFDRGSYRFHGRVKALAEAARKAGLKF